MKRRMGREEKKYMVNYADTEEKSEYEMEKEEEKKENEKGRRVNKQGDQEIRKIKVDREECKVKNG